jgi:D-serine deaminase-like pyridoxal phosphate-dependent protein
VSTLHDLPTSVVLIDLDALGRNVARMAEAAGASGTALARLARGRSPAPKREG